MDGLQRKGRQLVQPYTDWEHVTTYMIENEMARRGIRYKQLSRMLEEQGIYESADQINRKVNRKRFSAAFLLACLTAMGVENITLKLGQDKTR